MLQLARNSCNDMFGDRLVQSEAMSHNLAHASARPHFIYPRFPLTRWGTSLTSNGQLVWDYCCALCLGFVPWEAQNAPDLCSFRFLPARMAHHPVTGNGGVPAVRAKVIEIHCGSPSSTGSSSTDVSFKEQSRWCPGGIMNSALFIL